MSEWEDVGSITSVGFSYCSEKMVRDLKRVTTDFGEVGLVQLVRVLIFEKNSETHKQAAYGCYLFSVQQSA
jgi:hypothetical protein